MKLTRKLLDELSGEEWPNGFQPAPVWVPNRDAQIPLTILAAKVLENEQNRIEAKRGKKR